MGSVERFGDRFLNRILLPPEIAYCRGFSQPGPLYRARFAAKEAVSRPLAPASARSSDGMMWRSTASPAGTIRAAAWEGNRPAPRGAGKRVHITLTHTQAHAAAMAVLEG
jgi:holo-[acyl-carrier protein] synthase